MQLVHVEYVQILLTHQRISPEGIRILLESARTLLENIRISMKANRIPLARIRRLVEVAGISLEAARQTLEQARTPLELARNWLVRDRICVERTQHRGERNRRYRSRRVRPSGRCAVAPLRRISSVESVSPYFDGCPKYRKRNFVSTGKYGFAEIVFAALHAFGVRQGKCVSLSTQFARLRSKTWLASSRR
jgi:hypothetical protein